MQYGRAGGIPNSTVETSGSVPLPRVGAIQRSKQNPFGNSAATPSLTTPAAEGWNALQANDLAASATADATCQKCPKRHDWPQPRFPQEFAVSQARPWFVTQHLPSAPQESPDASQIPHERPAGLGSKLNSGSQVAPKGEMVAGHLARGPHTIGPIGYSCMAVTVSAASVLRISDSAKSDFTIGSPPFSQGVPECLRKTKDGSSFDAEHLSMFRVTSRSALATSCFEPGSQSTCRTGFFHHFR